ncbi:uncharacterized protein LOC127835162 [Dreissena polymorpha]|uniref:G-protein coupled receptors family 1 profile domain-containing protein n=1 Tax=Dreissena polymorpha TaxID=45954 RepID=A0A9D4G3L0_DREPO|nr:uncharacterized protein LOC127835162 [Dreissena polymorpha]KAH3808226.1 hypothetical protein DPMN_136579 [Dreissena polymorpha]
MFPGQNTTNFKPKDGYDMPVLGLDNGSFYHIHIPAMSCIIVSLICSVTSILLSFRRRTFRNFFSKWSKSERFVVYLAFLDGYFNVFHFTDHLNVVVTRDHVRPKGLCVFYGYFTAVFVAAEILMVNVVAINVFMLLYCKRKLYFGKRDWKLLAWIFFLPVVGSSIAAAFDQFGPTGATCFMDSVKGTLATICFTTVPLTIVLVMNMVLYILSWKRIHDQCREVSLTLGTMSAAMQGSHRAARAMSMFVTAFFIQWWAVAFYGVWGLASRQIPQALFHVLTIFTNLGGILNLIVFAVITRSTSSREHLQNHGGL